MKTKHMEDVQTESSQIKQPSSHVIEIKRKYDTGAAKEFTCSLCQDKFKTKTSLKKHRTRNHGTKQAIDNSMNIKDSLREEETILEENATDSVPAYACDLCVVSFPNIQNMDKHMDYEHEGRLKIGDVIGEGDEYEESSLDESDEGYTDFTSSEEGENSESGEVE